MDSTSSRRFSAADQLARLAAAAQAEQTAPEGEGGDPADGSLADDAILQAMMPKDRRLVDLSLDEIHPAAHGQTRQAFDPEKLESLAESIRNHGVKEPILVRPDPAGGYELVAGERRWRAARAAGLTCIPAIVERKLVSDDDEALLTQVAENVHREDLNPVEEAAALVAIMKRKGWTVEQAAKEMGKNRSDGYRLQRLHGAPAPVKARLLKGRIEFRAAAEFVRLYEVIAKQDSKKALARLEKIMAKAEVEAWPVVRVERYTKDLIALTDENGLRRGRKPSEAKPAADGVAPVREPPQDESAPAGATESPAPDTKPPLFTRDAQRLSVDLAQVLSGQMIPEERAELITILDELLSRLRRR